MSWVTFSTLWVSSPDIKCVCMCVYIYIYMCAHIYLYVKSNRKDYVSSYSVVIKQCSCNEDTSEYTQNVLTESRL